MARARRRPGRRSKHASKKTDVVMRRHADGHSCYYGCTPALGYKCADCPEDDCVERVGFKTSEHYYMMYGGGCRRIMLRGGGKIEEYPNLIKNAKRCMKKEDGHPHEGSGGVLRYQLMMKKVR